MIENGKKVAFDAHIDCNNKVVTHDKMLGIIEDTLKYVGTDRFKHMTHPLIYIVKVEDGGTYSVPIGNAREI